MSLTATSWTSPFSLARLTRYRMCVPIRPPQPTKPTLIRSLAPSTRPVAKTCLALLCAAASSGNKVMAVAPALASLKKSLLDFFSFISFRTSESEKSTQRGKLTKDQRGNRSTDIFSLNLLIVLYVCVEAVIRTGAGARIEARGCPPWPLSYRNSRWSDSYPHHSSSGG